MRSHGLDKKFSRSKNKPIPKRKTVSLTLWVKPVVKAELQRRAEREGVSISHAGSAFLEKALQQDIDVQYGAMLRPVIEQAIDDRMRSRDSRLALLLVRVAFASEQTRSLVANILGRQEGVTPQVLDELLDRSSDAAKGKITRSSPQLDELIAEVKGRFAEKDRK